MQSIKIVWFYYQDMKELNGITSKEIKKFQDETKNKKELNWQDKKRLEELLESHKKMEEDIDGLKNELSEIQPQEEKYLDQKKELQEKSLQLEKLMDEVRYKGNGESNQLILVKYIS